MTPYLIKDFVDVLDVDKANVICRQGVGFSLHMFIEFFVLQLFWQIKTKADVRTLFLAKWNRSQHAVP